MSTEAPDIVIAYATTYHFRIIGAPEVMQAWETVSGASSRMA